MAAQFLLMAVKQIKVKGECLKEMLDLISEFSPDEGLCMNYLKYKMAESLNAPDSLP